MSDDLVQSGFARLEDLLRMQDSMPLEPDRLPRSLARLEQLLRILTDPVVEGLQPGLDEEGLRLQLAVYGLVPPEDLVSWFGWHDGYVQPHGQRWSGSVALGFDAMSLAEALGHYTKWYLGSSMTYLPAGYEKWFPILRTSNASVIMMYCGHDLATNGTVAMLNELGAFEPDSYQAPTLAEPVEWWCEAIEAGLWYFRDTALLPIYGYEEGRNLPQRIRRSGMF